MIYRNTTEAELIWVPSGPSYVPNGAVIAGHTARGSPLYLANIFRSGNMDWTTGNYDPIKDCAEYGWNFKAFCGERWKLAVSLFSEFHVQCNRRELVPDSLKHMLSFQYRNAQCRDKTVLRSSYLHHGISCISKMTSLYWIGPWSQPLT